MRLVDGWGGSCGRVRLVGGLDWILGVVAGRATWFEMVGVVVRGMMSGWEWGVGCGRASGV
jgi:hypothetical protein